MQFFGRLIVVAAWALAVAPAPSKAQTPVEQHSATAPLTPPAMNSSATVSVSSAPIDARIILGLTYVRGTINGSRPLDVVLDSGAGGSIVTPQLAEELHLKTGETRAAAGPGKGGDNLLHMIPNATLKLGGTTLIEQTIAALPIDYIAQQGGVPTEGIFGGNVFTRLVVDEDYAAHTVRLLDPATFTPPAGFVSVPVDVGGNVAFTQLDFQAPDGSKLSGIFVIDSGTVGDLVFSEPFVKAHASLLSGKHVDVPSVTAVGGKMQLQAGRIPALILGSFVLKEPVAIFPSNAAGVLANAQIAGILGNGVLKRFHVIFDWPHQRMLLAPGPDVNARFPANCSGLSLRVAPPDYHRLLMNDVIAGSPAAQAGIRAGDVIKAVGRPNTIPRPNEVLQLAEIRTELEEPGQSFIVQIDRDGKPMRFEFVTRDMY